MSDVIPLSTRCYPSIPLFRILLSNWITPLLLSFSMLGTGVEEFFKQVLKFSYPIHEAQ